MKKILLPLLLLTCITGKAENKNIGKGFYKDIFMDSGINLSSRIDLPAARYLNLSMEVFASNAKAKAANDTILQNMLLQGSPIDENGILLYPDGAPRFRMVYMNGGLAASHGRSLGEKGRNTYRQYVKNGGSFVGTCAGAYITSKGVNHGDSIKYWDTYLGIWPGIAIGTGIIGYRHGVIFEKESPLLKYYDYGGDGKVDSVYHHAGCMADEKNEWPEGTEVLARMETTHLKTKKETNGKPIIWAYKANEQSGRVIPCGSHPEGVKSGERLHLMCAMVQYAMDGNGAPTPKGELQLGKERKMTASTHDNNPAFTKIGDKQYHHFTIDVPEGLDTLSIQLKSIPGYENYDMYLFANKDDFAWMDNATYQLVTLGFDKVLTIDKPKAGKYYLSVYCNTTVDSENTAYGTQYYNRTDVLNGVPYTIGVNIKSQKK